MDASESDGQVYIKVRCFSQMGLPQSSALDAYIFGIKYKGFEEEYSYRINGDGSMEIQHTVDPQGAQAAFLPRMGLTLTLDASMQQVNWYGRGPQENYPDRKTGYKVGIYKTTVDEIYEPYLIPQAVYQYQLEKQDGVTVNLDYETTGLGCTARYVLPSYRTMPRHYERKIIIKPIQ